MTLGRTAIRYKLYARGFGLGFHRTATAIADAAKTVTDAVGFQNAAAGEGDYKGMYIYRPGAAAANQVREASTVSGTSLTHEGLAYSGDASVLDYEIVGLLHPDEINEAIRLGVRLVYFETYAPVTVWTDGDFSGTDETTPYDWTATASATTVTKSTTQANNFRGFKSLVLTGAGYTISSTYDVTPGDIFVHGAAGKGSAATTTTTYSLLDVTHSDAVLETVAITGTNLQHIIRRTEIPAGCYQVRVKLQTSGTSIWDYTHSHMEGLEGRQIEAPSWLSEQWRLMGFGPADYGRDLATRLYNARSQHFNGWKRPRDYQLMPLAEEANPYHVQVTKRDSFGNSIGLPDADMWYHGLRSYGDISDMSTEASSTEAPEDLVLAACMFTIATMLLTKTEDAKWARLQAEAATVLRSQRDAQGHIEEEYTRSVYVPGGRGGP